MSMLSRLRGWVRAHPVISALVLIGIVLIGWTVLRPRSRAYAYVAEPVVRGEVVRRVTASGRIRALNTFKVGAEISGQILAVHVDFNTPVAAGQLLAEIDPTRPRARVAQAEAAVASAEAALAQARAGFVRAQTDIAVQDRDFARREALAGRGFLSRTDLDGAENARAAARAGLQTGRAQIASAQAQIAQARAELSAARLDLARTRIVAPAAGVVINRLVDPGATVAASFQTPNLFEIAADTNRMQVEAAVDEADIGQVREGQSVTFTVDSYPGERFAATVRQIRKAPSEAQNVISYAVVIDVDNRAGKLLPGMTANVEIVTGLRQQVLRAPAAALRFRPRAEDRGTAQPPRGTIVWVAGTDPYRPSPRRVTLGLQGEDHVEIRTGLRAGERVLVRSRTTARPRKDAEAGDDDSGEPGDDG
jgi:HlyD family secretion protein